MRKTVVMIVLIVGATLLMPMPAMAWGHMHNCDYRASHTNAWGAYLYHRLNLHETICAKTSLSVIGPHPHYTHWLKGASTPTLTIASRTGVPSADELKVTKRPYLSKIYRAGRHVVKLRYSFVIKKCTGISTGYKVCWDRSFRFYVTSSFTRICSMTSSGHLKCDDRKWF